MRNAVKLNLSFSPEDKARLLQAAKDAGFYSVSEFVRFKTIGSGSGCHAPVVHQAEDGSGPASVASNPPNPARKSVQKVHG